jgi:penicillin-binding protein 1A
VAWMGYDKPRSLGGREYGGTVALPIWIDYMRTALRGSGPFQRPLPSGLAQADGDWMYEEYVNSNAVRSVGVDDIRSLWDRLFGNRTQQPQADRRKPLQEEMTYRGGN